MNSAKTIRYSNLFQPGLVLFGLLLSLTTLAFPVQALAATAQTPGDEMAAAINRSGRQRMLSQRMLKAYCQIALHVRDAESKSQLDKAVELFDRQLLWLKSKSPTKTISDQLAKVEKTWAQYKTILSGPVNREGAKKLIPLSDQLLAESHQVVIGFQNFIGGTSAHLVNISGRQRMLSQRVAKFYMLKQLGFKDESIGSGMDKAVSEFAKAHKELMASKINTDKINASLEKADIQWQLYRHSISNNDGSTYAMFVALSSDKVLALMNTTTGMYEKVMATNKVAGNNK